MAVSSARLIFSKPILKHLSASRCFETYRAVQWRSQRTFQTSPSCNPKPPHFAFAFDIDGVLFRSSQPLPRAREALAYLQKNQIPFILLTNGGGKQEADRVAELSHGLKLPLDTGMFIQSHTPFEQLVHGNENTPALKDKCILVLGGEEDNCRRVAENYGFKNVVSSADIITACPRIMPFASTSNYAHFARPLVKPVQDTRNPPSNPLKIDAIFVFNDPRDWVLDIQIVLDLLLSHAGILGTLSSLNGETSLPNRGYQQDGQPQLYFSNPDLFWAAQYHLPRLGQGGFREALEGVWKAVTGGEAMDVKLQKKMFGKPFHNTYEFAERRLEEHRSHLFGEQDNPNAESLQQVFMIGDNPESDILGANSYKSPRNSKWHSILVRSGVYSGGEPAHRPSVIVDDVWDAVQWGLRQSGWKSQ